MLRALDYRERPAQLLGQLDTELNQADADPDPNLALRDYLSLSRRAAQRPDAADWILTMKARERRPALEHARARWQDSGHPAWLIAALTLARADDPAAAALAADAGRVAPGDPAWLTAQYHLIRLTIASADAGETRARLDSILARPDLTLTERNLFAGERAQVAHNLDDFARFALRRPYCVSTDSAFCVSDGWADADRTLARRGGQWVGLGADARAIIDRMPLADRIAMARSPLLPAALRLDIALTGFLRAVLVQDDRAIDAFARDLALLLPQMRRDWLAITAQRRGPGKRFAEFFAMAKIPGLRPDLVDYTRPRGTIPQFRGYWRDWMLLPRGAAIAPPRFPAEGWYLWDNDWYGPEEGEAVDLTCLGQCGAGGFPVRLPGFVAERQDRTAVERAAFTGRTEMFDGTPVVLPAGGTSVWEELLAYARAHPRDSRSPEALYWLIRIARWGGNHDHIGRRAFQLLHRRYPGTTWARRSPYYYD